MASPPINSSNSNSANLPVQAGQENVKNELVTTSDKKLATIPNPPKISPEKTSIKRMFMLTATSFALTAFFFASLSMPTVGLAVLGAAALVASVCISANVIAICAKELFSDKPKKISQQTKEISQQTEQKSQATEKISQPTEQKSQQPIPVNDNSEPAKKIKKANENLNKLEHLGVISKGSPESHSYSISEDYKPEHSSIALNEVQKNTLKEILDKINKSEPLSEADEQNLNEIKKHVKRVNIDALDDFNPNNQKTNEMNRDTDLDDTTL